MLLTQKGFTLAEVSIAALLLAIGATGIFAVVLTCRYNIRNNQAREELRHYARKVTEDLRGYVRTVDSADTANAPGGNWMYPPDSSACAAWALDSSCTHDVTSLLPAHLRDAPFSATLKYTVETPNGNDGPRKINVLLHWEDVQ